MCNKQNDRSDAPIGLYALEIGDLWFREKLLSDEETMSYNHAYGGTIDFPEEKWAEWYQRWGSGSGERFYRYLQHTGTGEFVGEVAYRLQEDQYIASVIIHAAHRNKGYGRAGLRLLCEAAKAAGIDALYDDIAIDNPSAALFLGMGFEEVYRTEAVIMLKKTLTDTADRM